MALTFEDSVRAGNDQLLSILTQWQQGTLEAYDSWITMIRPLVPDVNLYHEMPTAIQDTLGNPDGIIDGYYRFWVGVLGLWREFAREVLRTSIVAPRTPYVPPAG